MTLGLARTPGLAGIPISDRVQGRDSLNVPLLRFSSPLWRKPENHVSNLSAEDDSPGILFPSAHEATRVHVLPFDGKTPNPLREVNWIRRWSHPPATVPLSGFLNLSATLFLSLPPYHFQEGSTHGIAPSRGLFLSQSLQQLIAAGLPS
jgi:hypothetical protein